MKTTVVANIYTMHDTSHKCDGNIINKESAALYMVVLINYSSILK